MIYPKYLTKPPLSQKYLEIVKVTHEISLLNLFQKNEYEEFKNKKMNVEDKHFMINISWFFKGTPDQYMHDTTLTWAAFENNPLIDWLWTSSKGGEQGI